MSGSSVTFPKDYDGNSKFKVLPEGDYILKIKKAEVKKRQDARAGEKVWPYYDFTCVVMNGPHKGEVIHHRTTTKPDALFALGALLEACGIKVKPGKKIEGLPDLLVGNTFGAHVTVEEREYKGSDGKKHKGENNDLKLAFPVYKGEDGVWHKGSEADGDEMEEELDNEDEGDDTEEDDTDSEEDEEDEEEPAPKKPVRAKKAEKAPAKKPSKPKKPESDDEEDEEDEEEDEKPAKAKKSSATKKPPNTKKVKAKKPDDDDDDDLDDVELDEV